MPVKTLDATGLTCPQPTIKVTVMATTMKPGDELEVISDCSTFEKDVEDWCRRTKKDLEWVPSDGEAKRCRIKF